MKEMYKVNQDDFVCVEYMKTGGDGNKLRKDIKKNNSLSRCVDNWNDFKEVIQTKTIHKFHAKLNMIWRQNPTSTAHSYTLNPRFNGLTG